MHPIVQWLVTFLMVNSTKILKKVGKMITNYYRKGNFKKLKKLSKKQKKLNKKKKKIKQKEKKLKEKEKKIKKKMKKKKKKEEIEIEQPQNEIKKEEIEIEESQEVKNIIEDVLPPIPTVGEIINNIPTVEFENKTVDELDIIRFNSIITSLNSMLRQAKGMGEDDIADKLQQLINYFENLSTKDIPLVFRKMELIHEKQPLFFGALYSSDLEEFKIFLDSELPEILGIHWK